MRYWFDTEFIEDGKTIDLISIGIVAEDSRELYFQNYECDFDRASDWVKENVFPCLEGDINTKTGSDRWKTRKAIAGSIIHFVEWGPDAKPEFWGYYADYDWVVFCQLFGTMMDLPKGFPMYCRDIKQLCDDLGAPALPPQDENEHHALADARWNKQTWEHLKSLT
jgi:3' exoribonuclease, RNase T-like